MTKIRVGLIGAGGVVSTLHAPLLKQLPDVSIEWVFDINEDAAGRVAQTFRIPGAHTDLASCGDVDAVLLAIPVGVRDSVWQAAVARRWHVLCEKPATRTVADLDEVLSAMQRVGRVVSFGLMRRYYHGVLCLRDLVVGRAFGDPIELWAGEGGPQPRTGRGTDWYQLDSRVSGGGVLIETGSHLLDQLAFILGASTYVLDDYAELSSGDGLEFDARVFGRIGAESSAPVPFSCVISRSQEVCNGVFVRYPKMTLVLRPGPGSLVELRDDRDRPLGQIRGAIGGAMTSFQAFRDEWLAFLAECRSARPADPVRDNRLTRVSVGLIEACYRRSRGVDSSLAMSSRSSS